MKKSDEAKHDCNDLVNGYFRVLCDDAKAQGKCQSCTMQALAELAVMNGVYVLVERSGAEGITTFDVQKYADLIAQNVMQLLAGGDMLTEETSPASHKN